MQMMRTETPEEKRINDLIDQWHEGNTGVPLHEFLGMTWEQYGEWLESNLWPKHIGNG
jgi:hypothetical protein